MDLIEEWNTRRVVMEAALEILSDGQPHTSRQILMAMMKRGLVVPKRLINSVLFSEARRYVSYDRKAFTYCVRQNEVELTDDVAIDIGIEGIPQKKNSEVKARYIGRNDEYIFLSSARTGPAFFDTSVKGRTIEVVLNRNHPLFVVLDALLDPMDGSTCEETEQRLLHAQRLIELLLAAWAKYENDLPDGPRKFRAEESRVEWGRHVRQLLTNDLGDEV